MPVTSGVFGKADLVPGALTRIWYNSSTNAATCNIIFCNRNLASTNVRIAIIPSATSGVRDEDYIVYNQEVPTGSTFELTGVVVGTQETIFCFSSMDGVSVRVHGFVDDRGAPLTDIGMATNVSSGLTLYASGLDITSTDKSATPALVKAIVDAFGGTGGTGGGGFGLRMTQILSGKLLADTELVVPSYQVGRNKVLVFINGILCAGGADRDVYAYTEIGSDGAMSTSIKFFDSYDAGTEITVIA